MLTNHKVIPENVGPLVFQATLIMSPNTSFDYCVSLFNLIIINPLKNTKLVSFRMNCGLDASNLSFWLFTANPFKGIWHRDLGPFKTCFSFILLMWLLTIQKRKKRRRSGLLSKLGFVCWHYDKEPWYIPMRGSGKNQLFDRQGQYAFSIEKMAPNLYTQ